LRESGSIAPGDEVGISQRPFRVLERTKATHLTLRGLVAELAQRGLKGNYRAVWNLSTPRS
jgi:putative transposase